MESPPADACVVSLTVIEAVIASPKTEEVASICIFLFRGTSPTTNRSTTTKCEVHLRCEYIFIYMASYLLIYEIRNRYVTKYTRRVFDAGPAATKTASFKLAITWSRCKRFTTSIDHLQRYLP